MTKYKLNQIVEFKHKNEVLFGEIIGIRDKDNQECTYCIYNEEYVTHCDTHIMEESDLNSFSDYSIKFVNNINSRAFWKIETNIIGEKLKWETLKNEKEIQNAKEIKMIENAIQNKKNSINRYQKK